MGFKEARALFVRLKDRSGVGYCLTGLGGASRVEGRHKESHKYYTEANRVFRGLKDTFGIAYSYCGIANSLRMQGDFKGSLKSFEKARTNYKKIGDKVSYAYTLWGEGTAFQMLGMDERARAGFETAQKLFKETKDKRGLVYCRISLSELAYGNSRARAIKGAEAALERAKELSLGVETRYAREVLKAMKKGTVPLNLA